MLGQFLNETIVKQMIKIHKSIKLLTVGLLKARGYVVATVLSTYLQGIPQRLNDG